MIRSFLQALVRQDFCGMCDKSFLLLIFSDVRGYSWWLWEIFWFQRSDDRGWFLLYKLN